MAVQKATTTSDITESDADVKQPTLQDRVDSIVELSDPDVVADVKQPKTVKVKSPLGAVTEVPESIKDALVESGYTVAR